MARRFRSRGRESTATRINLTLPDDVRDMTLQLKSLWSHVDPDMDPVEIMRRAFQLALRKVDPTQRKKTSRSAASAKQRGVRPNHYSKKLDRQLWAKAGSQCQYEHAGHRCESRHCLQREHIIPLALGGTNELSNIELLCATHNPFRAWETFGKE